MLPNHFITASPTIAQYDWVDFVGRAGFIRFYPCHSTVTGPVESYFLTSEQIDGDRIDTSYTLVNNTNTEINFDLTIQSPTIVASGVAHLNYTISQANTANAYIVAVLYHVSSGAVESSIGTATSTAYNNTTGVTVISRRLLSIPIASPKSFAIGEKLRLSLTFYSATATSSWYYDPGSRQTQTEYGSGATIGTEMTIDIPFKIDL